MKKCKLPYKSYNPICTRQQTQISHSYQLKGKLIYRMFHNCWNKVAVSQIFPVDFILFLFLDYCWEIVNILTYLLKYREIMTLTMEPKIFCVTTYYETKSFKIVWTRYRRKFNFITFPNRSQIFKLVKNSEAHGSCEDHGAMISSPCGPLITQKECACVINNFERRIKHLLLTERQTFGTWSVLQLLLVIALVFRKFGRSRCCVMM